MFTKEQVETMTEEDIMENWTSKGSPVHEYPSDEEQGIER